MQNDAKLGLLAGVAGVVVAAVVSVNRPQPPAPPAAPPSPAAKRSDTTPAPASAKPSGKPAPESNIPKPVAPAVLPNSLTSTPVVRTRSEPDATPTGRTKYDDIDP